MEQLWLLVLLVLVFVDEGLEGFWNSEVFNLTQVFGLFDGNRC